MSKFLLQSGGGFFTLQDSSGVLLLQSTTGTVNGTGTGSISSVTMAAPAATALSSPLAAGSIDSITITAPNASASGAVLASGSIDSVATAAPDATASGTISATATGSIGAATISAPAASTLVSSAASGAIDSIAISAPSGVGSASAIASGSIDNVTMSPATGVASGGGSVTATVSLPAVTMAAISATTNINASVSAEISPVTISEVSASPSSDSIKIRARLDTVVIKAPKATAIADNGLHKTVISQYANSPIILSLINNYTQVFNGQQLIVDFVSNIWDVRTANSQGLDIWGRIVGVSRYLTLTNQDYFGFDPDFDPFNESPFFAGTAVTSTYILGDEDFRRVILAKALNNITVITIPSIERVLSLLFGHRGTSFVKVTGDFELTYVFNFDPTELDQAIVEAPDLLPKPAGFTIINDFVF